jgi:cyclopropane fatty-acyl-phospholipid synthase-like methyltransferase
VSAPQPHGAVIDTASAYYRVAGKFAWYFARGKLSGDPAFRAILEHGLLEGRTRLLDLGAGQGLLAAWLLAARSCHASERVGAWPRGWPPPPDLRCYTGIEINPQEVRRARRAFALDTLTRIQIVHGDIRDSDYGSADAIVMLDVLHYSDYAAQERILQRVRAALVPGGLVLMRVGDAQAGLACAFSQGWDRSVAFVRRGHWLTLHCRALADWQALLQQLGFTTRSVLMRAGALRNQLLLAHLP